MQHKPPIVNSSIYQIIRSVIQKNRVNSISMGIRVFYLFFVRLQKSILYNTKLYLLLDYTIYLIGI